MLYLRTLTSNSFSVEYVFLRELACFLKEVSLLKKSKITQSVLLSAFLKTLPTCCIVVTSDPIEHPSIKQLILGASTPVNAQLVAAIIISLFSRRLSISELSNKYNVNMSTITSIVKNITHIKSDDRSGHATVYLDAFRENKHILDWVNDDRCVVDIGTLRERIKVQQLNSEEALTKLPDSTSGILKHTFEIDGEEKTISELIKDKNISRSAFVYRVFELGMDPLEASKALPGAVSRGAYADGRLSNNQKYTQDQVNEARSLFKKGNMTISNISKITGVSEASLYDITSNRSWVDSSYSYEKEKSDKIFITHKNLTLSLAEWSINNI